LSIPSPPQFQIPRNILAHIHEKNSQKFIIVTKCTGDPMDMSVTPSKKEEYRVGDILTCTADGFPRPAFSWTNMRTKEVFKDVQIILPQSWAGTTQDLKCEAYIAVGGQSYVATDTVNVYIPCEYIY